MSSIGTDTSPSFVCSHDRDRMIPLVADDALLDDSVRTGHAYRDGSEAKVGQQAVREEIFEIRTDALVKRPPESGLSRGTALILRRCKRVDARVCELDERVRRVENATGL